MYRWVIFLHILGAFTFVLMHGASASVSLRLRSERNLERVRALLDLSVAYLGAMYGALLLLLAAGVLAGFLGKWWGQLWIWISLGVLIALIAVMSFMGSNYYHKVRKAAGVEYMVNYKPQPPEAPSPAELEALLRSSRPIMLTVIGMGGLAIILWLMMFKPF